MRTNQDPSTAKAAPAQATDAAPGAPVQPTGTFPSPWAGPRQPITARSAQRKTVGIGHATNNASPNARALDRKRPGVAEIESPHTLIPQKIPATVAAGAGDRDHRHRVPPRRAPRRRTKVAIRTATLASLGRRRSYARPRSDSPGAQSRQVAGATERTAEARSPPSNYGLPVCVLPTKPLCQIADPTAGTGQGLHGAFSRPSRSTMAVIGRTSASVAGEAFGIGTLSFATALRDLSAGHNGWPSTRPRTSPRTPLSVWT